MVQKPRPPEQLARWATAVQEADGNYAAAARALDENETTLRSAKHEIEAWLAGEHNSALARAAKEAGIHIEDVIGYWYKNEYISVHVRPNGAPGYADIREQLIAGVKKHAPKYKRYKVEPTGDHMVVLTIFDLHVGKFCDADETGTAYDIEKAVERARIGADALIAKCRLHGAKHFLIVLGNDILHIDTPRKTTTSGTDQDTAGSIFTMFQAAKSLLVGMIEQLAMEAPVNLLHVPSNHDWVSGWMLSDTISSWFHNHPNVHVGDMSQRHRKYLKYGQNLLGFTHGDGAKEKDLHWHMAHEASEHWASTRFRYWYNGHLHHKIRKLQGQQASQIEKDHIGFTEIATNVPRDMQRNVQIEVIRSPSPADGWHDRNGYTNPPAIECFLHHPTEGQKARFTHFL